MKVLFPLICAWVLTAASHAQALSNATVSVIVSNHPIHDATLLYRSQGSFIDETRTLELYIHHLANGKIVRTGSVAYTTMNFDFSGHGDLRGRYRSLPSGDRCSFGLRIPIHGEDAMGVPIQGIFDFRASFVQESETEFFTSGTNKVCVRGHDCTGSDQFFSHVDPRARPWLVSLNLEISGNRISGSGEIVLITARLSPTNFLGRRIHYTVRGKTDERARRSVIRMSGIGEDEGSSLLIRTDESFSIESIRGKLLGQRADSDGPFHPGP